MFTVYRFTADSSYLEMNSTSNVKAYCYFKKRESMFQGVCGKVVRKICCYNSAFQLGWNIRLEGGGRKRPLYKTTNSSLTSV